MLIHLIINKGKVITMARVRKQEEYTLKKNKIIIDSISLLNEIGYNQFSINKAIASAGLTKGAFFHYFESKNELIDAIIDHFQKPMVENLEEIANDETIEPKDKISLMATSVTKVKEDNKETIEQLMNLLLKEENKVIGEMINEKSIELFVPIYEKVIVEGNLKGQFNVENPNGSLFMYFNILSAIRKEIGIVMGAKRKDQYRFNKLKEKVTAFEDFARNLFNLDPDTNIIDHRIFQ